MLCIPSPLIGRQEIGQNKALLNNLILDSSHPDIEKVVPLSEQQKSDIECRSRNLIYKLHCYRAAKLEYKP